MTQKKARNKLYYKNHRDDLLKRSKVNYLKHRDEKLKYVKDYAQSHKKERNELAKKWRIKHPNYFIDYRFKLKMNILTHYSGNPPKCACCDESEIDFLSIDHINNDGIKHRKIQQTGNMFYRWIIENNYPKGLQVLCMNCNFAKGKLGYCPHQKGTSFNSNLFKQATQSVTGNEEKPNESQAGNGKD
jgi:hypothetical protein